MTESEQFRKTCEEIYKRLCIMWEHEANFDLQRYTHFYVNPLFSFVSRNLKETNGIITFTDLEMDYLGNVDILLLREIILIVSEIRDNTCSVEKNECHNNFSDDQSQNYDKINVNGDLVDDDS